MEGERSGIQGNAGIVEKSSLHGGLTGCCHARRKARPAADGPVVRRAAVIAGLGPSAFHHHPLPKIHMEHTKELLSIKLSELVPSPATCDGTRRATCKRWRR
jgi:hypothetical protein